MNKYVDFDGLLERTMDDKEIALEILSCYVEETKPCIMNLKKALEDKNLSETRERAHEIKGSSASAGAVEVQKVAEKAQKESENGNLEIVTDLVKQIEDTFNATAIEIEGILK